MIAYSCGHREFDDDPSPLTQQRDERCPACIALTRISLAKVNKKLRDFGAPKKQKKR